MSSREKKDEKGGGRRSSANHTYTLRTKSGDFDVVEIIPGQIHNNYWSHSERLIGQCGAMYSVLRISVFGDCTFPISRGTKGKNSFFPKKLLVSPHCILLEGRGYCARVPRVSFLRFLC